MSNFLIDPFGIQLPLPYRWLVSQNIKNVGDWYVFTNRDQERALVLRQEFITETAAPNDALIKDFIPFAEYQGPDDYVGFIIEDGRVTEKVIEVHLTFKGKVELPGYPQYELYGSFWGWLESEVAHHKY